MNKHFLAILLSCTMFSSFGGGRLQRAKQAMTQPFEAVASPTAPDYSDEKNWAALPNKLDNCDKTPEGKIVDNVDNAVDVFWIHPTSYTKTPKGEFCWNADVSNASINKSTDDGTMLYQASAFNFAGKIYAPRYRQAHLLSFFTPNKLTKKKALAVAYSDVSKAFEYYLTHYNNGRPIIIASHSQGGLHAYYLLRDYFAHKPLMKQLVAAYIIGMPIPKDSLNFILPCADSSQTNCYMSWYTFKEGFYPKNYWEYKVATCVNPLTWSLAETNAGKELNQGAVLRKFNKIMPHLIGATNHESLLWIHPPFLFRRIKNFHIGDINLFYKNVRANAKHRVDMYLQKK